jgi:hypothetical protein
LPSRALLAQMLIEGREGVAVDHKRGFELAKEGARLGCHHCQGVMLLQRRLWYPSAAYALQRLSA